MTNQYDPFQAAIEVYAAARQRPAPPDEPPGADMAEQAEQYFHPQWRQDGISLDLQTLPAVGTRLVDSQRFGFPIRSVRLDNLSGYRMQLNTRGRPLILPPNVIGWIAPTADVSPLVDLIVDAVGANGTFVLTLFEERLAPVGGVLAQQGSGLTPLGSATASSGSALVAAAAQYLAARPNRTAVTIENEDPANSIRLASTFAGVALGLLLPAKASVTITTRQAIYAGAVTANCQTSYWEELN